MHPTINPRLPQSKLLVSFSYSFVFSFAFASSFASSFALSSPNVRDYAIHTSSLFLLPSKPQAPDARRQSKTVSRVPEINRDLSIRHETFEPYPDMETAKAMNRS